MKRLSLGHISFGEWLATQPSQAVAAAQLRVSQQYASKIALGQRTPTSHALVERIRSVCGIPPADWTMLSRRPVPTPARGAQRPGQ